MPKSESGVYRRKRSLGYRIATYGSMGFTMAMLLYIILFLVVRGVPNLSASLFETTFTAQNQSMFPAIVTTIYVVVLAILIAAPIGISTGIYLVEYAHVGSRFVEVIRVVTETLAGIPSIIYGLFGFLFFGIALNLGYSILSGVFTVTIMVLPPIVRATEEALLSVNNNYRLGSFALGLGKLPTIFKIVLPAALPGIFSGIILAIGRIVGETAALLFTLGTSTNVPTSLRQGGITLALHMWKLSSESLYTGQAFATGLVLLVVVLLLNHISGVLVSKIGGKHHGQ